jgi:PAS domain S-box-containing protein
LGLRRTPRTQQRRHPATAADPEGVGGDSGSGAKRQDDQSAPPRGSAAADLSGAGDADGDAILSRNVLERAEQLAGTGSWEWDLRTDALLWSDNMYRLLGLEVGEVTPTPQYVLSRIHPDDRERVGHQLDLAKADGTLPDLTYRIMRPDGTERAMRAFSSSSPEQSDGRTTGLVGCVQDITELSDAHRRTVESLTLMETLAASAPFGFAFVDRDCRIVRINDMLAEMAGGAPEAHIGRTVAEVLPDVWAQMKSVYERVLTAGTPVVDLEVEHRRSPEQAHRHWRASFYRVRINDEVLAAGLIVVDVTERYHAEHLRTAIMDTMVEGLFVVDHDGRLTLMNAAATRILGWAEEELRGKRMHDKIHFQRADGSPLAWADSDLLRVRTEGRAVRRSHDAFTCKDGTICPVAYSAAPLRSDPDAMVVVFRDTSTEQAEEERARRKLDALAWVGRIREALDQDRLILYSQPIVPLTGGEPSQELLLRMVARGGEIIQPGSFLPVAEAYGLIGEIDRWVIGETVRRAAAGEFVEANLSAGSIRDFDLLPLIEREVREARADASLITFEITETALIGDLDSGAAFARSLTEVGCRIALDDFGTGFGGFTYLKKLPISFLKIDIDFVRELATSQADQHLVKAIVGLAQDFGYKTIAEGVEDATTLALLKSYGVDFAQGCYLGPPAPLAPLNA